MASNPPGGNGAPNFRHLNLGVGVGGALQAGLTGAGRGDASARRPARARREGPRGRGGDHAWVAGTRRAMRVDSEHCGRRALGQGPCEDRGRCGSVSHAGKHVHHVQPAAELPHSRPCLQGCWGEHRAARSRSPARWGWWASVAGSGAALAPRFCRQPRLGQARGCQVRAQSPCVPCRACMLAQCSVRRVPGGGLCARWCPVRMDGVLARAFALVLAAMSACLFQLVRGAETGRCPCRDSQLPTLRPAGQPLAPCARLTSRYCLPSPVRCVCRCVLCDVCVYERK